MSVTGVVIPGNLLVRQVLKVGWAGGQISQSVLHLLCDHRGSKAKMGVTCS